MLFTGLVCVDWFLYLVIIVCLFSAGVWQVIQINCWDIPRIKTMVCKIMYYRTSCSKFCCALMILFVSQKMFKFIMLFSFLYSVWMRGRLIFMLKWKNLRARQVSNWVFLNLWCSVNFWDCWQLVTDQNNWCRLSTVHQWLTKWKLSLQWFNLKRMPHHPRWKTKMMILSQNKTPNLSLFSKSLKWITSGQNAWKSQGNLRNGCFLR